jgi:acyl dehydratase
MANVSLGQFPPAPPYRVTAVKIAEFADAIGDPHPAYRDPAAAAALGHPAVIAPPTFAILLCAPALASLATEGAGTAGQPVHRGQTFRHLRPIRAGDLLSATPVVVDHRTPGGIDTLTVRVDIHTAPGELVCTATVMLCLLPTDRDPS